MLFECSIIEINGQKFYVEYVEVKGSVAKPWAREVRLLGINPNGEANVD